MKNMIDTASTQLTVFALFHNKLSVCVIRGCCLKKICSTLISNFLLTCIYFAMIVLYKHANSYTCTEMRFTYEKALSSSFEKTTIFLHQLVHTVNTVSQKNI